MMERLKEIFNRLSITTEMGGIKMTRIFNKACVAVSIILVTCFLHTTAVACKLSMRGVVEIGLVACVSLIVFIALLTLKIRKDKSDSIIKLNCNTDTSARKKAA